jgi:hypothetical protein
MPTVQKVLGYMTFKTKFNSEVFRPKKLGGRELINFSTNPEFDLSLLDYVKMYQIQVSHSLLP